MFSPQISETLYWLTRQTHIRTNHARMLCGAEVGELLSAIIQKNGYRNILEIGVFTGYSSICLASASPDVRLDSLEINDELTDLILEGWKRAGVNSQINLSIGDAMKLIPELKLRIDNGLQPLYDLVYIDANKRYYTDYYTAVLPLLRQGGMIVADNVLWSGKALDPNSKLDPQTKGIKNFNALVENDARVKAELLPLRDGLYLITKL
ncbi:MAG: class I SAM-dependent methyltransferase [Bacteroidales bacterium]|nr:class I SAM-dependent methyltransferase [Bacteroidales bacterium]